MPSSPLKPSKRRIDAGEAALWLGILLDATFDPTSQTLNLAARAEAMNRDAPPRSAGGGWSARLGRAELLALASDFTNYPEDYPPRRQADMLLAWAERWVDAAAWKRLQGRIRQRRFVWRQRDDTA